MNVDISSRRKAPKSVAFHRGPGIWPQEAKSQVSATSLPAVPADAFVQSMTTGPCGGDEDVHRMQIEMHDAVTGDRTGTAANRERGSLPTVCASRRA